MDKVQICKLWSLEDIKPNYWFDTLELKVYNEETKKYLAENLSRGAFEVKMSTTEGGGKRKHVYIHKLVALSCIHNGPYTKIEARDGDRKNYDPANLIVQTAIKMTGDVEDPSLYRVTTIYGDKITGSLKDIASWAGVSYLSMFNMVNRGLEENEPYNRFGINSIIEMHQGEDHPAMRNSLFVYIGVPDADTGRGIVPGGFVRTARQLGTSAV